MSKKFFQLLMILRQLDAAGNSQQLKITDRAIALKKYTLEMQAKRYIKLYQQVKRSLII